MTYPAWFDFHRNQAMRRHPACGNVYAAMLCLENVFFEPRAVKAWVLAEALELEKETVLRALNLLVEHGFLVEHARGQNNVRRFTVATVVAGSLTSTRNPTEKPAA